MAPRWDWAPLFLVALERSGLVRASARAVGVGRRTAYDRRERDAAFAAKWAAALEPFRRGERSYDRRPLADFAVHRALAPLDTLSAEVGAVSVAALEARLGCSLDEYADKLARFGGDRLTKRIAAESAAEVRALARRARTRGATAGNPVKSGVSCAVSDRSATRPKRVSAGLSVCGLEASSEDFGAMVDRVSAELADAAPPPVDEWASDLERYLERFCLADASDLERFARGER